MFNNDNYDTEEYPMFLEYMLEDFYWDENVPAQEINMNPYSLTFFMKTLLCRNPGAIFLSSFLNLFEELPISTIDDPRSYSSHSHAMTIYILKMLEKNGIVKVIEYYSIEEETKNRHLKMYNIIFYKLRNLSKEDKALIRRAASGMHIQKYQIRFKKREGKLFISTGILEVLSCILTGHIIVQFFKNIKYWKCDEGFKADIDKALYSLNTQKKATTEKRF